LTEPIQFENAASTEADSLASVVVMTMNVDDLTHKEFRAIVNEMSGWSD
jgi:hypothetical protein